MKFATIFALASASVAFSAPAEWKNASVQTRDAMEDWSNLGEMLLLHAVDRETGMLVPKFFQIRKLIKELNLNPKQFMCGYLVPKPKLEEDVASTEALRNEAQSLADTEVPEEDQAEGEQEQLSRRLFSPPKDKASKEKFMEVNRLLGEYDVIAEGTFMDLKYFYCDSPFFLLD